MLRTKNTKKCEPIHFSDEVLLHIFSFFYKPQAPIFRVSQQWNNVGNDESLWRSYIKDRFLAEFEQSKLSAKEFYIKNKRARKNKEKVYCLASPLIFISDKWCTPNPQDSLISEMVNSDKFELSQKQLDSIFRYNNDYLPSFLKKQDAINCANAIYDLLESHRDGDNFEFRYPIIFLVDYADVEQLEVAHKTYSVPSNLRRGDLKYEHHFQCAQIKLSALDTPYAAYTKPDLITFPYTYYNKIYESLLTVQTPSPSMRCIIS